MLALALILAFCLLIAGVLAFLYSRPLTMDEVRQLAIKRRTRDIGAYFSHRGGEVSVDPKFKKKMKADGRFYPVDEDLASFPSIAAGLLKYKKHEWMIVALEKAGRVRLIWANKGPDKSQVTCVLPLEAIAQFAREDACSSVLWFHNHPNSDPSRYSCTAPSPVDTASAVHASQFLNERGINHAGFVCERGRSYRYSLAPADAFLPLPEYVERAISANGRSKLANLSLHGERLLG